LRSFVALDGALLRMTIFIVRAVVWCWAVTVKAAAGLPHSKGELPFSWRTAPEGGPYGYLKMVALAGFALERSATTVIVASTSLVTGGRQIS
jgi:hypothetical protein